MLFSADMPKTLFAMFEGRGAFQTPEEIWQWTYVTVGIDYDTYLRYYEK